MFSWTLSQVVIAALFLAVGLIHDAAASDLRITKVDGQWYQGETPITKDTVELVVKASPATIVFSTSAIITHKKAMARSYNRDLPEPGTE